MTRLNEEEIKKEIERSVKALTSARNLFEKGLFEDAISRAYYATLHAAKASLLVENIRVDSHEAVKRLLGLHLIKPGKIDIKYSKILREEQDDRYLVDYDVAFSPETERVNKRIEDAECFLNEMRIYIRQQGIDI